MVQPELWAAAALMLLGAAVSLCVRCQRSATKRETQLSQWRSQLESQPRFAVIRPRSSGSALPKDSDGSNQETPPQVFHPNLTKALDCTLQCGGRRMAPKSTTQRLEQIKEPENLPIARKAIEELSTSHHTGYGSRDESRYQNFLAENCLQEEAAYVEPISFGYYHNCTRFFSPPQGRSPGKREKDEDSYSYENVIIGESQGSDPDDAVDYENSTAIHTWKLQQGQALLTESLDDEPDYINTGPVSGPALLSEQRILHEV